MIYCMKHPQRVASHELRVGENIFVMCDVCAWNALRSGETLKIIEAGQVVKLDSEGNVVFVEGEKK